AVGDELAVGLERDGGGPETARGLAGCAEGIVGGEIAIQSRESLILRDEGFSIFLNRQIVEGLGAQVADGNVSGSGRWEAGHDGVQVEVAPRRGKIGSAAAHQGSIAIDSNDVRAKIKVAGGVLGFPLQRTIWIENKDVSITHAAGEYG